MELLCKRIQVEQDQVFNELILGLNALRAKEGDALTAQWHVQASNATSD
jgi:hypothetical protein